MLAATAPVRPLDGGGEGRGERRGGAVNTFCSGTKHDSTGLGGSRPVPAGGSGNPSSKMWLPCCMP
jgi:hypothetical protein